MKVNINNYNQNFDASWYDKFFESIPNKTINKTSRYNKLGQTLASPHWNRLAIGTAAITTQPFLDYFNPKVDKDTAKASALRTTAKIIVCTTVGFTVRGLCYKLTEHFAHASSKEGSTLLTPRTILNETNKELQQNKLKLHKNTFSTITALFVMLFTNFLIDAPGTTKLSNIFLRLANLDKKEVQDEKLI